MQGLLVDRPRGPSTNGVGRLRSITRGSGSVLYAYDAFGRLTQDGALSRSYDANGNVAGIVYPGGVSATYGYDFADRELSLSVTAGAPAQTVVSAVSYLPSGPLSSLVLGNGVSEARVFDARYFPDRIEVEGLRRHVWDYTTDQVGNVTRIAETEDCTPQLTLANQTLSGTATFVACDQLAAGPSLTVAASADITFKAGQAVVLNRGFAVALGGQLKVTIGGSMPVESTIDYGYQDYAYFLSSASGGPWGSLSWSYDKIGNRLTENREGQIDEYVYALNATGGRTPKLLQVRRPPGGGVLRTYTYGPAGHLDLVDVSGVAVDLTIDAEGRIAGMSRASAQTTLAYDRRSFLASSAKLLAGGPDTGLTEPTYSSQGQVMSLRRVPSPGAPEERVSFFYFAGRPVAQLSQVSGGSDWQFLSTDHLGTPALATDLTRSETWHGPFEPFGKDFHRGTPSGALDSGLFLRFPGQWEEESWLEATAGVDVYYNVYRWYETGTGRYTRVDPLSSVRVGRFLYAYADLRPAGSRDPLGLVPIPCEDCGVIVKAINNAVRRINLLNSTGTAFDPLGGDVIGAKTDCEVYGFPNGQMIVDPVTTRFTGNFEKTPCTFLCVGVHERVHRRMCRRLGNLYRALSELERELPAYETERRCLESAKENRSLELTIRGVRF